MVARLLLLVAVAALAATARGSEELPPGWELRDGAERYQLKRIATEDGPADAIRLSRLPEPTEARCSRSLYLHGLEGRRVRLGAWLRTEGVERATFTATIDGQPPEAAVIGHSELAASSGWNRHEVVLQLPSTATRVDCSGWLDGVGAVDVAGLELRSVDRSVPLSGLRPSVGDDPWDVESEPWPLVGSGEVAPLPEGWDGVGATFAPHGRPELAPQDQGIFFVNALARDDRLSPVPHAGFLLRTFDASPLVDPDRQHWRGRRDRERERRMLLERRVGLELDLRTRDAVRPRISVRFTGRDACGEPMELPLGSLTLLPPSSAWDRYRMVVEVPLEAHALSFRLDVEGGSAALARFELARVAPDVPLTMAGSLTEPGSGRTRDPTRAPVRSR